MVIMKGFLNDIIGQAWTLLGLFIAYIVLEGSAKVIVGWCIIVTSIIWIATYWLRRSDE
jgi:hypothetical protein